MYSEKEINEAKRFERGRLVSAFWTGSPHGWSSSQPAITTGIILLVLLIVGTVGLASLGS